MANMHALYIRTTSGGDHPLNLLATMPFLELPNELIERTLIELHPTEVVGLRQESLICCELLSFA